MSLWCAFAGCNYKPRYSEQLPEGLTFRGSPEEIAQQIQAAKIQVYEGDVCVACGMVANRPYRPVHSNLWKYAETMFGKPDDKSAKAGASGSQKTTQSGAVAGDA